MSTSLQIDSISYRFTARRRKLGVLITGQLSGTLPGYPYLEPVQTPIGPHLMEERTYRLVFRKYGDYSRNTFDYLEHKIFVTWRTIRILLPNNHEYLIHSLTARKPTTP